MTPRSMTLTLTFVKIAFLDSVAAGAIVFHKHTLIFVAEYVPRMLLTIFPFL